ncbi:hypothetical protein [Methanolobus sp. WCC4]|uniref:DUF7289 family protein n=1 Tax=Methanolobus sp. WCC4 TaxID=3125784 RepID=UPI0030FAE67F
MRRTGNRDIFTSEDALTEVVDFVITLGIMLLAISVIGLAGYPLIEHMKESGHIENIKQSFSVLAPNMNKIASGKAPSQSVELKMYGGGVYITGDSYMNITMDKWNDTTAATETVSYEKQLRMIQNEYKDTTIAYENTGTWARYPPGRSVMITKPIITYDNSSMVIPMVTITGVDGVSGSGLIRVISEGGQLAVERFENVSRVEMTISSEYYEAWERYLSDSIGMQQTNINTTTQTVSMEKNYSQNIDVLVTVSPMSISIE